MPGTGRGGSRIAAITRVRIHAASASVLAAALMVIAAGCGGGDDGDDAQTLTRPEASAQQGETAPSNLEFETLDAGVYSVEVPQGWEVVSVDGPATDPALRRTELRSPTGDARLAINRRPAVTASPAEQAQIAEQEIVPETGYERLRFEPVTLAGRDAFAWEFMLVDEELGPSRAAVYFLSGVGGAYRVQATASEDDPTQSQDLEYGRHAAETLRT